MIQKDPHPLRLEPPLRIADEALGERLAQLARASTPTPMRRRAAWRAPLASLAIVAATGGLAYGAQTVVHHIVPPANPVPRHASSPTASASHGQAQVRLPLRWIGSAVAEENRAERDRDDRSAKATREGKHHKRKHSDHRSTQGASGDRDRGSVRHHKNADKAKRSGSTTSPRERHRKSAERREVPGAQ